MLYIILFLLGAILGSFVHATVFRIHAGTNFVSSRSKCLSCSHVLGPLELIPILSYIVQRAKCKQCSAYIPVRYLASEIALGLLFVCILGVLGTSNVLMLVYTCTITTVLLFIFLYDLYFQLILDRVTLPALVLVLAFQYIVAPSLIWLYVIGLFVGAGFFLLQFVVSRGTWIGGGDIRLGALMGGILGWKLLLVALFIAYVVGAFVSLLLVCFKRKSLASTTPFGTYLTVATFVTMLWGSSILGWYIGLL